ncbi:MAG: hypothetical protein HY070_11045 [Chloroflexi bacterium]|nr:hypothetical protein [Chloroflexota bacterium]
MKNFTVGCAGFLLGVLFAVVVALSAFFFLGVGKSSPPAPENASSPGRADVTITFAASYLNAQLKQLMAKNAILKQPTSALAAPNLLKIAGVVDLTLGGQRVSANVTIAFQIAAKNSRVVLVVDSIDANGISVPQSLLGSTLDSVRTQAEDQINTLIQNSLKGTSLKLAAIRISASDLTLELTSQ